MSTPSPICRRKVWLHAVEGRGAEDGRGPSVDRATARSGLAVCGPGAEARRGSTARGATGATASFRSTAVTPTGGSPEYDRDVIQAVAQAVTQAVLPKFGIYRRSARYNLRSAPYFTTVCTFFEVQNDNDSLGAARYCPAALAPVCHGSPLHRWRTRPNTARGVTSPRGPESAPHRHTTERTGRAT